MTEAQSVLETILRSGAYLVLDRGDGYDVFTDGIPELISLIHRQFTPEEMDVILAHAKRTPVRGE